MIFSTTGTCMLKLKTFRGYRYNWGDNENSYNGNFEEYGSIVVGGEML